MFDTSRLVPEARLIVEAAATSYLRHTQPWLIGLIVYGSALKGGFIPGCSDIDLRLFLDERAFGDHHELPFAICLAIQRDLAQIDQAPFRYIQGKGIFNDPISRSDGTRTRCIPTSRRKAPGSRGDQSAAAGVCKSTSRIAARSAT